MAWDKEKQKEYMREYRKKNREKMNEYARKYYEQHPGIKKEYARKYYQEHKEEIDEKNKKHHAKFIETHNWSEYCSNLRKRRVERLREEGCINAWSVVAKGDKPKYADVK